MRYFTAGESHGPRLTAIIEGVPAGLPLSSEDINVELKRRQGGYGRGGRMLIESDQVDITSGVRHGLTMGSPITLNVTNKDFKNWTNIMSADDVEEKFKSQRKLTKPRPGHADLVGGMKYRFNDLRNVLERSSARETTMRVAIGAVAKRLLAELGIDVASHVTVFGGIEVNVPDNLTVAEIRQRASESEVSIVNTEREQDIKDLVDKLDTYRKWLLQLTICDPACGTAGFLVAASEYLNDHHSTEIFANPEAAKRFSEETFFGYDFDSTMLRIGSMNMMLHGVENPRIENRDSLSETHSHIAEKYSLILANPPFAGSLDNESCAKNIQAVVKTKKTELLFLALFLRLLKTGGRAAVIVPDGVLFGSSKAHKDLRKKIVEEQKLEAIISMPSGVFKPYAGVSTAIMIFTKTESGGTDKVWFYDMQADGYSLDDKRNELDASKHENNNIPDILARFKNLDAEADRKATEQSFLVDKADIAANGYDLSINRYKEVVYEQVEYEAPSKILADLEELEQDILKGMATLKEMLK